MKITRQITGFSLACLAGMVLPVAATLCDGLNRGSQGSSDWSFDMVFNATFVGVVSAFVGSIVGGVGIALLRSKHRLSFRSYVTAGAILGVVCGAFFRAIFNSSADPLVSWFVFIGLPVVSMTLGFVCYWFVAVKPNES